MKTCTNRIPDNCDSYECGRPEVRAGRCEACLPIAIVAAVARLDEMEHAAAEARARLRDLEGDTTDHAKRLAEIETLLASVPEGVWSWEEGRGKQWTLYVDRGEPIDPDWPPGICNRQHGFNILRGSEETFDANGEALRAFIVAAPTMLRDLLAELRAASEALTAAGIPDDGRTLADRVKALAERTTPKRCDDCGGTDAPHRHRFGCGMEPEDEPSTGLDVATAGDAKPMRTDGPIVRRTAVAESEDP